MKILVNSHRFAVSRTLLTLTTAGLLAFSAPTTFADNHQDEELPRVRMETSKGVMEIRLRPDVAPKTVENFLSYVREGFYDGTVFHRVIPGFMVQGGGFTAELERKPTEDPVVNEASQTLKNLRGTIAMARTQDPDSATSQFFINLVDNGFLDAKVSGPGYTVFGKVTEGMGVADAIAATSTGRMKGMSDVPVEPIRIQSVSVIREESKAESKEKSEVSEDDGE